MEKTNTPSCSNSLPIQLRSGDLPRDLPVYRKDTCEDRIPEEIHHCTASRPSLQFLKSKLMKWSNFCTKLRWLSVESSEVQLLQADPVDGRRGD